MDIIVNFTPDDRAWLDEHFKASPRPVELREPPRWAGLIFQAICWLLFAGFLAFLIAALKAIVEEVLA